MEFKDSRSAELFEAAAARGDTQALILQLIVAQVGLITVMPLSLRDKGLLVDGLGLVIDGLSPDFMDKHRNQLQNISAAMDADTADIFAQR